MDAVLTVFALYFMSKFPLVIIWKTFKLDSKNYYKSEYRKDVVNDVFTIVLIGPVLEEIIFRFIPITILGIDSVVDWRNITICLIFAIAHIINITSNRINFVLAIFWSSMIYSWTTINLGIAYAISAHILNNLIAVLVLRYRATKPSSNQS
jgi:membrane protease YdiL (CAAX protease family)